MGQRANLAIVGPHGFDLYYSHWCANTLPRDLFWGPDHAEAFIRLQRPAGNEDLLDTVWAEGGAVIDLPNRTFLFYGGEDIPFDVPLRRLYLKLVAAVWRNWKIQWAYEGIVDIAEYLSIPRSKVTARSEDDGNSSLAPPQQMDWISCVGSFQLADGLHLFPLPGLPEDYVLGDPKLADDCHRHQSYSSIDLRSWTEEFPRGGFHVNPELRTVDFWVSSDCPNLFDKAQTLWSGWRVTWHKDNYESQASLTKGCLIFNEPSRTAMVDALTKMLMVESKPVNMLELADRLAEHDGGTIEINPYALRDDRLPLSEKVRTEILRKAFSDIDAFEKSHVVQDSGE